MELIIENCNNIKKANVFITEGYLNIKFGINGTGKSTIAKAIELNSIANNSLDELMPFKYREDNPENISPSITGADDITNILIFNEDYINQFVFQENELIKNSFDIFIKDNTYKENQEAIEELIKETKNLFKENDVLELVIKDLEELSGSFGKSRDGYAKSGKLAKGLGEGNKLQNIPEGLEGYSEYLHNENNIKWLKWQIDGSKSYLNITEKCPYCTSPVENTKKEMIEKVSTEYNATAIGHLVQLLGIFERLGKYFSEETKQQLNTIVANSTGLSEIEIGYLVQVKEQVETLMKQLKNLQRLSFFSFENVDDIEDEIKKSKINLGLTPYMNSEDAQSIVNPLNDSLDVILEKIGILKGEIARHKSMISRNIIEYQDDINGFLETAGYKYQIVIEYENEEYKMRLRHQDYTTSVEGGAQHLSFGEKNAFSLILFMYECLSKNPDLIILDDPISSFDKNKKYAIIHRLFRGEKSFKDKTVLMLTHDFEPIVDMIKIRGDIFQPSPQASFLELKNNEISEVEIEKNDILTFAQLCKLNIDSNITDIAKIIYLRRYYEIMDDKGLEYQLLSNLQHCRTIPMIKEDGEFREMSAGEIESANIGIREIMDAFVYNDLLLVLQDKEHLKYIYETSDNSYEKLQIFRLLDVEIPNHTVDKFVKETYHIENEQISQLNPLKYELVPDFIIKECNRALI